MKIALVQYQVGSDLKKNLRRGLEAFEEAASKGANLVIFPELAFTPFYPQKRPRTFLRKAIDFAQPIPGPITEAFCNAAKKHGVAAVLNLYEKDGNNTYDTSPVINTDGTILGKTRMIHITQYEGFWEQDYYLPGDTLAPVYDTAVKFF